MILLGFSGSSAGKELNSWVGKIHWRRDKLPTPIFLGFPGSSDGKESACNAGDLDSIPGLGRSPGGGNSCPLQYSCLENSIDRGAWQATVHGIAKTPFSCLWEFIFCVYDLGGPGYCFFIFFN